MIGKIILITGISLFCLFPAVALLEWILKIFRNNREGYYKLGFNWTELFFAALIRCALLVLVAGLTWLYFTFFPGQTVPAVIVAVAGCLVLLDFLLFLNHLLYELSRKVLYDPVRQVMMIERSRKRILVDLKDRQWQVTGYAARYRKLYKIELPGAILGKTVLSKGNEHIAISHLLLQYHDLYIQLQQRPGTRNIRRQINFIR